MDQRPIVVTRPDLERLRLLIESARKQRRWEEMHLEHQPEAAARPHWVAES